MELRKIENAHRLGFDGDLPVGFLKKPVQEPDPAAHVERLPPNGARIELLFLDKSVVKRQKPVGDRIADVLRIDQVQPDYFPFFFSGSDAS